MSRQRPRAELVPLATCGPFVLLERRTRSSPEWLSLQLNRVPPGGRGRNSWWFGWSVHDRRLSRNSDTGYLAARHPEILQWVMTVLRGDANTVDEHGQAHRSSRQ